MIIAATSNNPFNVKPFWFLILFLRWFNTAIPPRKKRHYPTLFWFSDWADTCFHLRICKRDRRNLAQDRYSCCVMTKLFQSNSITSDLAFLIVNSRAKRQAESRPEPPALTEPMQIPVTKSGAITAGVFLYCLTSE